MNEAVKIELQAAPETARALRDPRRRQAVEWLVDRMVRPTEEYDPLAAELTATRKAAREAGLTDADIDAEIAAHKAERAS